MLIQYRNSTVGDVARKLMGDVPIAYVETAGGIRVSEDDVVAVGKHDVCLTGQKMRVALIESLMPFSCIGSLLQGWQIAKRRPSQQISNIERQYVGTPGDQADTCRGTRGHNLVLAASATRRR
jgi:hypothetical protein